MRNQRIRFLAPLAAVLVAGGCLENSLGLDNPNQTTVLAFWKTAADAEAGLNASYRSLMADGTYARNRYWVWDHRTDIGLSRSPASNILNFSKSVVAAYNEGFLTGMWTDVYRGIFRMNQVINQVPAIEMNTTRRDQIVAEAKFMRGLLFYEHALIFGNGPIPLDEVAAGDTPAWHTQTEVYAQALKDATEAAAVLPYKWTGANIGRATKGGALALIAEINMNQKKWTEAVAALQTIVSQGGYSLLPTYGDLFRVPSGDNSVESLFEIQFGNQAMATLGARGNANARLVAASTGYSATGNNPVTIGFNDDQPTNWAFMQFFAECPTKAAGCLTYNAAEVKEEYRWTGVNYPAKPDPRLDATIFYNRPGGMDVFGTPFTVRYRLGGPNNGPGFKDTDLDHTYFHKKYQEYWRNVPPGINDQNNEINLKVYRYGHVLMFLAEALTELNRVTEALVPLNQVRARVGLPKVETVLGRTPTQAELRDWIDREFVLEMFWENKRLAYMQRQGKYVKGKVLNANGETPELRNPFGFSLFVNGKSELMPIPQGEIDTNCGIPNQVGCEGIIAKQNPGWN